MQTFCRPILTINITNNNPEVFYNSFFAQHIWTVIADQTNGYVRQQIQALCRGYMSFTNRSEHQESLFTYTFMHPITLYNNI